MRLWLQASAQFMIRLPYSSCGNESPSARVANALSVELEIWFCRNSTCPSQKMAKHPLECPLDAPRPPGRLTPFTKSASGRSRGSIQLTPEPATSITAIVLLSPSVTSANVVLRVPAQTDRDELAFGLADSLDPFDAFKRHSDSLSPGRG